MVARPKSMIVTVMIVPLTVCFAASCTESTQQEVKPVKTGFIESAEKEGKLTSDELHEVEGKVEDALNSVSKDGQTLRNEKCVAECKKRYRDKITLAKSVFDSKGSAFYHDLKQLNKSLDAAKNEFDACLTTCN